MPYERKTIDILISDELRNILNEIKSDSVVAELLLKRRHLKDDIVDSPVNYISVSSNDRGRISYLTVERIEQISDNEHWSSSRRFHTKPGGFVTKIFKNISSQEIEKFSNLYRSQSNKPRFDFSILKGEDIRTHYHYSKHASESGTLGSSCMKHDSCQKLMDLYVKNTENISLLTMLNSSGYVMGRALIWNFDGKKVMDRIYTVNDEQLTFYFKKWASDNGYYYKSQQNWYNSCFFEKLGDDKKLLKFDIKLKDFDLEYYPYMDTFKFFTPETGTFSNYKPEGREFYTLCSSDGSKYEYNYLMFDDIDKYFRHRGDCIHLSYTDINTHPDRCNYSDVNDCYILREDCVYDDMCRDYIFKDDLNQHNDIESIKRRRDRIAQRDKMRSEKEDSFNRPTFQSGESFSSRLLRNRFEIDGGFSTNGQEDSLYSMYRSSIEQIQASSSPVPQASAIELNNQLEDSLNNTELDELPF